MKRFGLFLLMGFLAMAVSGLSPLQSQELDGAAVYSNHCALCHQPRSPAEFSDAAWAIIVHHMHTRGYLTLTETFAVRKFLLENNRTSAVTPPGPSDETATEMTATELIARNGCRGCHIIDGKGGTIGPNLDTVFARRDADYLLQKLTNPRFDNRRSVMPFFPLTEAQKQVIIDHLKTVQR